MVGNTQTRWVQFPRQFHNNILDELLHSRPWEIEMNPKLCYHASVLPLKLRNVSYFRIGDELNEEETRVTVISTTQASFTKLRLFFFFAKKDIHLTKQEHMQSRFIYIWANLHLRFPAQNIGGKI